MDVVMSFVAVLAVAVAVAGAIGLLYASGLRLWAAGALDSSGNAHLGYRIVSVLCFSACAVIVLFALWLMIPAFH
ncbi:MAG: hypothetical protein Q4F23_01895 [Coriobacteriia bacterium]|nr:hypothetical protein [Coriobacteriia bacterium]